MIRNAFTVDIEDYYHVSAFAKQVPVDQWPHYESRVVQNTRRLLRLLAEYDVSGSFFVLGWVAQRYPFLVREIRNCGHEIGCHSHWHRLVYDLTPEEFRDDLLAARCVLEDIIAEPVTMYRAPSFSITRQSLWALEILTGEGFTIDSSIYPIRHDRYGMPAADPFPHGIQTSSGTIREFPAAFHPFLGLRLPVSGGGYFRMFPSWLTEYCLHTLNSKQGQPFMFYIHPWEIDPDQPRMPGSRLSRFRHYQNLSSTQSKLKRFLPKFQFGPMSVVIDDLWEARETVPAVYELDALAGTSASAVMAMG